MKVADLWSQNRVNVIEDNTPWRKLCLAGDTFDMVSRMFKWIMKAKYLNVHKVSKNIDLTKLKNNELK